MEIDGVPIVNNEEIIKEYLKSIVADRLKQQIYNIIVTAVENMNIDNINSIAIDIDNIADISLYNAKEEYLVNCINRIKIKKSQINISNNTLENTIESISDIVKLDIVKLFET